MQGWWDQGPGLAGGSCGFLFQELSLFLFSVSFLCYQCLVLNVGTRIALLVRDVGKLQICIIGRSVLFFCAWNCGQWTPVLCWPFCSFSLFVFATCGLWWWMICCQRLLIRHVIVALHVWHMPHGITLHLTLKNSNCYYLLWSCSTNLPAWTTAGPNCNYCSSQDHHVPSRGPSFMHLLHFSCHRWCISHNLRAST